MSSNSIQIIPQHKGRKIFLNFILIMLIVQVVIFAGEFRPYLRNDIQSFQDFTYFLSSGDGY